MVEHWDRLPWEAAESLFIEISIIQVEQGLKKPNFRCVTALPWLLVPMTSRSPFRLKFFYGYKYIYNIFKESDSSQETV